MNVNNDYQLGRFRKAVDHSRQQLQPFRENRVDMIEQFVGSWYSDGGPKLPVPIMFLEMAVAIYTHNLIGGKPRAMVRTRHPDLKPTAADLSIALNYVTDEIRLEDTLLLAVQDALFTMGIVRLGIADTDEKADRYFWHELWQPFCDKVDFDDWVHDTSATHWDQIAFEGNRYRVPLIVAKEAKDFNKKEREKLVATRRTSTNEEGDDKASIIGGDFLYDLDEFEDYVELWDYYLPDEDIVVTMAEGQENVGVLKEAEFEGNSRGPYRKLGFIPVPSNIMPLPPVAIWREVHDLANDLYRKLGRQAVDQKSVLPVQGGNPEDVENIRTSKDGDILRMDGQPTKEIRYGGPDQVNLAFFLSHMNVANRQAGNLDTLGGLRTGADTLGQEQMLQEQASGRIVYMRRRSNEFVSEIQDGLSYYLFKDPFVNLSLEKPGPEGILSIPIFWGEHNEEDYRKFNIEVNAHSLLPTSPQAQAQKILMLLDRVILPLGGLLQQQGMTLKMESLLKKLSEYMDVEEVIDFFHYAGPPQEYERGPAGSPTGPTQTSRTYERVNRSSSMKAGDDTSLAQALLGKPPGGSEMAGLQL